MFNTNAQDDEDMVRQMRTLYIRSNKLLRTFHYCSTDVKLELFKSYCTSFYCCYLWTAYKKSTFDRLRVAFNNAYRRVLGQPWRCSATTMYANFGINNFEATIRKLTFGFIQRLATSTNSLIVTIEKSWSVRLIFGIFGKKLCTLLLQHEFTLQMLELLLVLYKVYYDYDMTMISFNIFFLYLYFYIL